MAKQYRLTILEDDTHKCLQSFRLSKVSLILVVGSVSALAIILMYCIIAFTPLHYLIPGYPDAHSKKVALENAIKIDSLENTITRWEIYADNLSRVLSGQETVSRDSILHGNATRYLSAKSAKELSMRDSILKLKVKNDEMFGLGTSRSRTVPIEGMHFFTPVKGVVSNGFDPFSHPAVDITAKAGDMVFSVLDGTIISTSWDEKTGYSLQIQHTSDIISSFMHCQKLVASKGTKIKAGSPVAMLGSTGSLTQGDYLHFELWYKGEAVDPQEYISF